MIHFLIVNLNTINFVLIEFIKTEIVKISLWVKIFGDKSIMSNDETKVVLFISATMAID